MVLLNFLIINFLFFLICSLLVFFFVFSFLLMFFLFFFCAVHWISNWISHHFPKRQKKARGFLLGPQAQKKCEKLGFAGNVLVFPFSLFILFFSFVCFSSAVDWSSLFSIN